MLVAPGVITALRRRLVRFAAMRSEHPYELSLALNDIDPTRTKVKPARRDLRAVPQDDLAEVLAGDVRKEAPSSFREKLQEDLDS